MAGEANWTMEQGARFVRTLTYKNEDGQPIDLTGYSVRMDIRGGKSKSATLIHDLATAGDISITDAAGGEVTVDIPDETTAGFSFGTAFHDVELEDSAGNVTRLVQGKIWLDKEVTD